MTHFKTIQYTPAYSQKYIKIMTVSAKKMEYAIPRKIRNVR